MNLQGSLPFIQMSQACLHDSTYLHTNSCFKKRSVTLHLSPWNSRVLLIEKGARDKEHATKGRAGARNPGWVRGGREEGKGIIDATALETQE